MRFLFVGYIFSKFVMKRYRGKICGVLIALVSIFLRICFILYSGCSTFEASGYGYKFMFAALPRSSDETISVEFAVRANDQVHIALSSHNDDSSQMYEVVIGGWFDTKSVIRRRRQGQNVVAQADPSGWLDGDTYKPFWIRATPGVGGDGRATLTIRVGRGSDTEPFMGYLDTSPLSVSYLGFSMWGDSVGEYRFCGLELAADN